MGAVFAVWLVANSPDGIDREDVERLRPTLNAVTQVVRVLVVWLYFALLESSAGRATLGKRLMGLTVTDAIGGRISFLYAAIRFVFKAVCICLCFPVLLLINDKGQMPHDQMAQTLVVTPRPPVEAPEDE